MSAETHADEGPLRVLYFGDPRGALALLDRGIPLCGVVHGRRGGPGWQALLTRLRADHPDLPRWLRPDLSDPQVVSALVIVGGEPRLKGLKGHERALSLPQLRAHLKGEGAPVSPESREAAQGLWRRLRQLSEELGARREVAV